MEGSRSSNRISIELPGSCRVLLHMVVQEKEPCYNYHISSVVIDVLFCILGGSAGTTSVIFRETFSLVTLVVSFLNPAAFHIILTSSYFNHVLQLLKLVLAQRRNI